MTRGGERRPQPQGGQGQQCTPVPSFVNPHGTIVPEFDIPQIGQRVDAVLVTLSCVIPIKFRVGAKKFERLDYEQARDVRRDLKNLRARDIAGFFEAIPHWPLLAVLRAHGEPPL